MSKKGFFYFALACEKKEKGHGRRFRNFQEVISHAGQIWKDMSPRQREPYIEKAKQLRKDEEKAKARNSLPSTSKPMQKPAAVQTRTADKLISSIQKQIEQAEMEEGLEKEVFYIISMAYFCKTFQGGYLPAELAVVKFSIQDGVLDNLHMHINPGKLPLGMALEAQKHGDSTHGLPLPPHALGEANYDEIAKKLLTFLDVKEEIPALFTQANDVPMVECMLGDIMAEQIHGKTLHVSTVAELFYQLKLGAEYHMMSTTLFPSAAKAQELIDEDLYNHTPNISCEYHECHISAECALSKSIRSVYTIVMNCCQEMGVEPIPGQHFPRNLQERSLESLLNDVAVLNSRLNVAAAKMPNSKERTDGNKARYAVSRPSCSGLQKLNAAYEYNLTAASDLDTSDPVPKKRPRYYD